jgi:hypothetical protein
MDETTRSEVEKALHRFEKNVKERARAEERRRTEKETFEREFARLKREIIRPIMEEVGSLVKKLGHDYNISESESHLQLQIIPSGLTKFDLKVASISFDPWPTNEIRISRRPTYHQNVKPEEITKNFVEKKISELMKGWKKQLSGKKTWWLFGSGNAIGIKE